MSDVILERNVMSDVILERNVMSDVILVQREAARRALVEDAGWLDSDANLRAIEKYPMPPRLEFRIDTPSEDSEWEYRLTVHALQRRLKDDLILHPWQDANALVPSPTELLADSTVGQFLAMLGRLAERNVIEVEDDGVGALA